MEKRIRTGLAIALLALTRVRVQGYWPDNFGIGNDGHALFRGLAHGDLRVGKHIQMFVQFGYTTKSAGPRTRQDGSEPPDLQQGFLAWNGEKLSLRAGRQKMSLGTSRLIAAQEGPNIRRAFDKVRQLETRIQSSGRICLSSGSQQVRCL